MREKIFFFVPLQSVFMDVYVYDFDSIIEINRVEIIEASWQHKLHNEHAPWSFAFESCMINKSFKIISNVINERAREKRKAISPSK